MRTPSYSHSQTMWLLWIALPPVTLTAGLAAWEQGSRSGLWVVALVTLSQVLLLLVLGRLTIELDQERIVWRFGYLGWPRWELALRDVLSAEVVRTTALEGWGIRRTRLGMLYNASGFGAVALHLEDGRLVRLGSDEADRLAAFIGARLPPR